MLTEIEAQSLMIELISLRNQLDKISHKSEKATIEKSFKRQEDKCVRAFSYLVSMHTNRYRQFANHDDLVQEGFVALLKAMNNYDVKKGSWFWWAHKYIGTRVSRQANLHTTIRFPLKIAKEQVPKREFEMPILIEETFCPDDQTEAAELTALIYGVVKKLRGKKKKIIDLYYGFNKDKQTYSITKICELLKMSRPKCLGVMKDALSELEFLIKL
jgi:RNA polymerase sigma factor (sigma-70 family)